MASEGTKTYDPSQVSVIYAGQIISGFADGESIAYEANADRITTKIGMQGHVTRNISANRSAKFTFTLEATSESNAIFQAALDATNVGGEDAFPVFIRDNSGFDIHKAELAWVMKQPSASYGTEAGTREWVLETGCAVSSLAGN